MGTYKQLKTFKTEEIFLTEDEARLVLKFIFQKNKPKIVLIESAEMNEGLRGFAQGLLLEAIDASFKIGFVQAIWEATANPTSGVKSIIKGFTEKALLNWFDNITAGHQLKKVKIYDFVRDDLAWAFGRVLDIMILARNKDNKVIGAIVEYKIPTKGPLRVWV